jgi:hypothetical protein
MKINLLGALLLAMSVISGCAIGACSYKEDGKSALSCTGMIGMVHELKDDPTVGWFTGFFLSLGINGGGTGGAPTPASANAPYTPHLTLGYGTFGRVGVHDEVVITVGSSGAVNGTGGQAEGQTMMQIPTLNGMSSMFIRARNCGEKHDCKVQDAQSALDTKNQTKMKNAETSSSIDSVSPRN